MKKMMIALMAVLITVGLVGIGTYAYFSDTETSTGNTFAAGSLNLTVDDQNDPNVVHVTKTDMKPQTPWTYQGYNQQWVLKNVGSLPGTVSVTIKNVENFENGLTEPETSLSDLTSGTGNDQGELGDYTWVQWSKNGGSVIGAFSSPHFDPFNTAADVEVIGPVMQPGDTLNAYMWLDFPRRLDNMENLAQSDSLMFDIEFKLVQIP